MQSRLYYLLLRLFGLLPLGLARLVGRCLAKLLIWFPNNSITFVTERNIQLTNFYDDKIKNEKLVRESVSSTMQTALEMPIIWRRSNSWLDKKINQIENAEILENAIAHGKGVIVLCPHIGNWEVFGRKLPEFGPTTNLYQPPRQTYLEELVRKGRELSGASLVPTTQRGIAAILKALKRGEITGILPDQRPEKGRGLYAPFFGVPAYTMNLIYSLVQKTGCEVVLGYAIRHQDGFKIIFKQVPTDLYSSDNLESVVALSTAVETSLEEQPDQYQWSYKRFRKQPDGFRPYSKKLSEGELSRFNRA